MKTFNKKGVDETMEKLGYVILISIYLISFSIGKNFLNNNSNNAFSRIESISNQRVLESVAKDVANAIGMDDFFDALSKGL